MRNAWRVFTRDARRLGRVRKAWIILIGLMFTPSLYAWVNIAAFWDPYSNTEAIDIAVVNLDEGASSSATGDINVGDRVVEQLRGNDQLGWHFPDEGRAMEEVRSGASHAAIIIPADFSRDFTSVTSGDFIRPSLQYHVNEKSNAVAPQITDVGATTLDRQINSTFVSVVAETVTDELKSAGRDAEDRLRGAQGNTIDGLAGAVDSVGSARERIASLQDTLAGAQERVDGAKGTLDTVDTTLGDVQTAVAQSQEIVGEAQRELIAVSDAVTNAYTSGATLLADASSDLNESIAALSAGARQAGAGVDSATDTVATVIGTGNQELTRMRALLEQSAPGSAAAQQLSGAITGLQDRLAADQEILDGLGRLGTDVTDAASAVEGSAAAVNSAIRDAATSAGSRNAPLRAMPELTDAFARLSGSAGEFSSALGAQRTQLSQAQNLLTGLVDQLGSTRTALGALDGNFADAQEGLDGVRTDVLALGNADVWDQLRTVTGLDTEQIGQFLASPVEVQEHAVYPVDTYGSAMAPLFINLALWVGAFVLCLLMKLEVDTEGTEGLTARQAYLGRWLLLAVLSVFQALFIAGGSLLIGVQTVNAPAFLGTSVLIGLAYLSIIYALAVAFGYVGKGLAVVLVIMQIPGASGLYPIEVMPGFVRGLYNVLPFTYGIDAMRETIAGFQGADYWRALGVLAIFVALAFGLGLVLRPRMGNLILMFNRRIADTGLLVSEDVQIASGRHRLSQLIDALVNREEYRSGVLAREERFTRRYPTLVRGTALAGLAGVAIVGLVGWLAPIGKVVVLTAWVVVGLLVAGVLVMLEYTRQSIRMATDVGEMSEAELRRTLADERAGAVLVGPSLTGASQASPSSGGAGTTDDEAAGPAEEPAAETPDDPEETAPDGEPGGDDDHDGPEDPEGPADERDDHDGPEDPEDPDDERGESG